MSCDTEGRLFTQLIGRSVYDRIRRETRQMEMSQRNFATVYMDTGSNRFMPLFVQTGVKEAWALDRILEHALKRNVVPDVLKVYSKGIIKLGEIEYKGLSAGKTGVTGKTTSESSSRVLNRLSYYEKQDIEVSVPIYKADYSYPLIVLKQLPKSKNTMSDRQNTLILDSAGDIGIVDLPLGQFKKAERRLKNLNRKGKDSCLICLRKTGAISIDVLEISESQRQALDTLTQLFEETRQGQRPLSTAVRNVIYQAKEKALY
ncbi:hypothetical protein ACFLXF_03370 [Chloroflexota bacterium]